MYINYVQIHQTVIARNILALYAMFRSGHGHGVGVMAYCRLLQRHHCASPTLPICVNRVNWVRAAVDALRQLVEHAQLSRA